MSNYSSRFVRFATLELQSSSCDLSTWKSYHALRSVWYNASSIVLGQQALGSDSLCQCLDFEARLAHALVPPLSPRHGLDSPLDALNAQSARRALVVVLVA